MVKPHNNKILSVILNLIIFIVALDDFDSPLVITIAFALVILPVMLFIALTLFLHKEDLKKIVTRFASRSKMQNNKNIANIDNVAPMKEFHIYSS